MIFDKRSTQLILCGPIFKLKITSNTTNIHNQKNYERNCEEHNIPPDNTRKPGVSSGVVQEAKNHYIDDITILMPIFV